MATHSHIGNPCKICAFPLTGKAATDFLENKTEPGIMASEPHIMRPSKCPKCDNELIKRNKDELVCTMCYFYWIDGKWFRVCCDDFHNHTKKCLIEIDDVA